MLVTATVMAQIIMYGSYTMWLMMPYLTKVWDMSIMRAAAVVNMFDGVVAILPLGLKFVFDSLGVPMLTEFLMLIWCGFSSTLGLLFITMSTPPVLSKATHTCSRYEPSCIGDTQKTLFYVGLVLLATGMATCLTSLRPYIFEQAKLMGINKPQDIWSIRQALVQNEPKQTLVTRLENANSCFDPNVLRNKAYHWPSEFWLYRCNGVFTVVLVVLVFWVMPWSFRLGIPVIILLMSSFLFVVKPWFRIIEPQGGSSSGTSTHGQTGHFLVVKTIAKTLAFNFPIWATFVIGGLVSSVGNTYFIEQAGQMNPKLGHWEVPTAFFLLFYKVTNLMSTKICIGKISSDPKKTKWIVAFSFGVSILMCVIAALVEHKRLDIVKKHGLIDKSDASVPLSMFLMLPQFFLLGIFDGAYNCCVFAFFQYQISKPMKRYLNSLMHFVLGLGILCNVLSVYLAGRISSRGKEQSWFQHTLNKSRLDNYYWLLAVLSAINLAFYILVAICYSQFEKSESEPGPELETEDVEELEFKRLDWFDLLPLRQ